MDDPMQPTPAVPADTTEEHQGDMGGGEPSMNPGGTPVNPGQTNPTAPVAPAGMTEEPEHHDENNGGNPGGTQPA